jgi:predicted AlkP superfamily pyrophosphatase or phosphodiesterase
MKRISVLSLIASSTVSLTLTAPAQTTPPQDAPPRLVVAILVDQLRYDYLERFHNHFGPGGFRTFTERGAFLTFAQYDYAPTVTGPGHASFLSGATPSIHGIIGNDWFDKKTGKSVNCVNDPDVAGVGVKNPSSGKRSPKNFIGSTLSDEMRLRFRSKVVGISLKDRGAILPAGRNADGAYWLDSSNGKFVTSTWYKTSLPDWLNRFNERQLPASYVGQVWKRLLPESAYPWSDTSVGEGRLAGEKTSTFDHVIKPSPSEGLETIVPTPFGNTLLRELAEAAIDGEQLGRPGTTDFLSISFSSTDACGHIFGPYSQEMQDIILRLDLELERLFKFLDQRIGLNNITMVLTADHGVAPVPEFAVSNGFQGGRADVTDLKLTAPSDVAKDLTPPANTLPSSSTPPSTPAAAPEKKEVSTTEDNEKTVTAPPSGLMADLLKALSQRFQTSRILLSPKFYDGHLFYDHRELAAQRIAIEDVNVFIREWALSNGRFQSVFTRNQLLDGRAPGALGDRILKGYNAERGGDIVLVLKPFILPGGGRSGTTHGAPFSYDTHVPVAFHGRAFKPGRYADFFSITDIAPTLSAALRMNEPSGNIGKPFTKALK